MTENPYESPSSLSKEARHESTWLIRQLQAARAQRQRWALACWIIGVGLLSAAAFVAIHQHGATGPMPPAWGRWGMDLLALGLAMLGVLVFVLGPISWYWFRKSDQK